MATGVWHVKHVGCCLNVTAVRPREFAAEDPKLPASDSGGTAAKDLASPSGEPIDRWPTRLLNGPRPQARSAVGIGRY